MMASDGKLYIIQAATIEGIFRLIQSIPSPKGQEIFKDLKVTLGYVAFEYPEVQVSYASTNQYSTEVYSSPADKAFFFDFK